MSCIVYALAHNSLINTAQPTTERADKMLSTKPILAPNGRFAWTVYVNGVAVWTQIKMYAGAEIAQLAASAKVAQ